MRNFLTAILFTSVSVGVAFAADDAARFENRLNELMIWKLSDEMALKPAEEQKLKGVLKKYQDQRKHALSTQDEALSKLNSMVKKGSNSSACPTCLTDVQKAMNEMASANSSEFKELQTILGAERLGKFLVIRSEMTRDVREALRIPAQSSSKSN